MATKIFVVDSSPAIRRMVEQISAPEGYEVIGFQDGPAALESARRMSPRLIIADYHLANMTFSGFCKEIAKSENLAETQIVSLINPADGPDEQHLQSLGVRSSLKKPLQNDDLLDLIRNVLEKQNPSTLKHASKNRTWPPVSAATDLDEVSDPIAAPDDDFESSVPQERPVTRDDARPIATPSTSVHGQASSGQVGAEDAMKGFFDQLLHSMRAEAERKVSDMLPLLIRKELNDRLASSVREEVTSQLSQAKLLAAIRAVTEEELPRIVARHVAELDRKVREQVADLTPRCFEETTAPLVREVVGSSVQTLLPELVKEHLGNMDELVKSEVRQVAGQLARQSAEDTVREMAREPIDEAARRIVPEVAETQVKEAIKRLSAA